MAHITADRVQETTTTTGTGAITLAGAVAGFRTFASVMATNDTCYYVIQGTTEWEVGVGTFNTTLTRTTVQSSSNAGAPVNFSAGTKNVFLTATAKSMVEFEPSGAAAFPIVAAEPTAPAAGNLLIYSRSLANRILPKIMGPAGIDTILQVGLSGNSVFMLAPQSGTTAPLVWGGTLTTAATMSVQQTIA
jgi:hypothetical protein